MTIDQIGGPGAPYQPSPHTLQQIETDIAAYENTWNNLRSSLLSQGTAYHTAYTDLDNAIQYARDLAAQGYGPTSAEIIAARQDVLNKKNAFTTAQTTYYTTYNQLNTAATGLINAYVERQKLYDGDLDDHVNQFLNTHSNDLDPADYQNIQDAISREQTARNTMLNEVNAFRNNEANIRNLRKDLLDANKDLNLAGANVILTHDSSDWVADLQQVENTYAAIISNVQTNLSAELGERSLHETALSNSIDVFLHSFDNDVGHQFPGLSSLIHQSATTLKANIETIILNIENDKVFVESAMASILAAKEAEDTNSVNIHNSTWPTVNPIVEAEVEALKASYAAKEQEIERTREAVAVSPNLPDIPGPNENVSISDLMRFVGGVHLYSDKLAQSLEAAEQSSRLYQMLMLQNSLLSNLEEYKVRLDYYSKIIAEDATYNQGVIATNKARYENIVAELGTIQARTGDINTVITEFNQDNANLRQRAFNLVNGFNSISKEAIDAVNEANLVDPTTINTLDLFNDDTPDKSSPGFLPYPTDIATPPEYVNYATGVPAIPSPPYPTTGLVGNQAAFNTQLEALNKVLYPIRDRLAALQPPLDLNFIEPLYYNTRVHQRTLEEMTDLTLLTEGMESLINTISNAINQARIIEASEEEDNISLVTTEAFRRNLIEPLLNETKNVLSVANSVGLSTSDPSSASAISRIASSLVASEAFQNILQDLLERGLFVASIPVGLRMPQVAGYSSMGLKREDMLLKAAEGTKTKKELMENALDLQAIASGLLKAAQDDALLMNNAIQVASRLAAFEELNQEQRQQLIDMLIATQKMHLLTSAGMALAGVGPEGDVSSIQNRLDRLFGEPLYERAVRDDLRGTSVVGLLEGALAPTRPVGTFTSIPTLGLPPNVYKDPFRPGSIAAIFDRAEEIAGTDRTSILKEEAARSVARLGVPDSLVAQVRNADARKLGTTIESVLKEAPHEFIRRLDIRVDTLPAAAYQKIGALADKELGALDMLNQKERMQLALAAAGGYLSGSALHEISKNLLRLKDEGAVPDIIKELYDVSPFDIAREPRERIKEIVNETFVEEVHQKQFSRSVESFSKVLIEEKDFHQFALQYFTNVIHVFRKQFGMMVATKGKLGESQTQTDLPV